MKSESKIPLVHCQYFGNKLNILYEFVAQKTRRSKPRNDTELAAYVGVAKSTVATWRNGADNKHREAHFVSPIHIEKLSEIYSSLSQDVQQREAYELWVDADLDSFRRRLRKWHERSILALLKTKAESLEVEPQILPNDLGLITEDYSPEDGELIIPQHSRFALSVNGIKGRVIIILSHGSTGLLWLSPSKASHDGRISTEPESVPHDNNGWRATLPGKSELYCIELAVGSPPYVRPEGGPMEVVSQIESALIDEMSNDRICPDWRWCKIPIVVEEKQKL